MILSTAAGVWIWISRYFRGAARDLLIDRVNRTVTLPVVTFPVIGEQNASLTVAWSAIPDVIVTDYGDSDTRQYVPMAVVVQPDGTRRNEQLSTPLNPASAAALTTWTREQRGLPQREDIVLHP